MNVPLRFVPVDRECLRWLVPHWRELGHHPGGILACCGEASNLRRLTSFSIGAGDADWSPDGTRILFEASPSASNRGDVYVIRANGKQRRNLTQNPISNGSADPVRSPDGTKILFSQVIARGGDFVVGPVTMKPHGN